MKEIKFTKFDLAKQLGSFLSYSSLFITGISLIGKSNSFFDHYQI